jgi:ElaB/YqjD/DUF883 family membrane-anchored ribosome-binding protein
VFERHVASLLPFAVLEAMSDKPLRIRGVAMCSGMSRNLNIYTSEELQAFSSKLEGAPIYIEHVSVNNAVGKVTKTDWDGQALWYEAEIYESETADKIRKGLVQHVSVGADYEAIDVVDGKVPHGLHNAELSLVAVPGIPETNLQVLEKLASTNTAPAQKEPEIAENVDAKSLEELVEEAFQKGNVELKEIREKLVETEGKLSEANAELANAESRLAEAQSTIEQLRNAQQRSDELVTDPPKTMPVAEAIAVLEGLLPSPMVERCTLGMQRECQAIRNAVLNLKERLQSA